MQTVTHKRMIRKIGIVWPNHKYLVSSAYTTLKISRALLREIPPAIGLQHDGSGPNVGNGINQFTVFGSTDEDGDLTLLGDAL
ncbi:MAG: hypothetical protein V4454_16050 [Pseudomonadota bacterium]